MKISAMRILDLDAAGYDLGDYDFIRFSDGWRRFDIRATSDGIEVMADIGSPVALQLSSSNHFYIKWPRDTAHKSS